MFSSAAEEGFKQMGLPSELGSAQELLKRESFLATVALSLLF